MPEFIRVRDTDTKHEFTIPAAALRDGLERIDKPAMSPDGRPLPPKHHKSLSSITPVESEPEASKAEGAKGRKAAKKEGA